MKLIPRKKPAWYDTAFLISMLLTVIFLDMGIESAIFRSLTLQQSLTLVLIGCGFLVWFLWISNKCFKIKW